mmetsp:Transcript_75622/g.245882  ORF Transcript_75622/g.245882 Transcript_75622/m.245882 type:complete len:260 (+) Transcript_75622:1676-2455(+)
MSTAPAYSTRSPVSSAPPRALLPTAAETSAAPRGASKGSQACPMAKLRPEARVGRTEPGSSYATFRPTCPPHRSSLPNLRRPTFPPTPGHRRGAQWPPRVGAEARRAARHRAQGPPRRATASSSISPDPRAVPHKSEAYAPRVHRRSDLGHFLLWQWFHSAAPMPRKMRRWSAAVPPPTRCRQTVARHARRKPSKSLLQRGNLEEQNQQWTGQPPAIARSCPTWSHQPKVEPERPRSAQRVPRHPLALHCRRHRRPPRP